MIKLILESKWKKYLDEIDINKDEFRAHSKLCPKVWLPGEKIKANISKKLLSIANNFVEALGISDAVIDIILTGSLASYNWNEFSDLDLHILVDFSKIDKNVQLVKKMLDSKRSEWNLIHNIKIQGHEVEIYFQGSSEHHISNGIYSLTKDQWIIEPEAETHIRDMSDIEKKSEQFIRNIEHAKELFQNGDFKAALKLTTRLKTKLSNMRKAGLADEGLFSPENLTFKVLRKFGYLKTLSDLNLQAYDELMSSKSDPIGVNFVEQWKKFGQVGSFDELNEISGRDLSLVNNFKRFQDQLNKQIQPKTTQDFRNYLSKINDKAKALFGNAKCGSFRCTYFLRDDVIKIARVPSFGEIDVSSGIKQNKLEASARMQQPEFDVIFPKIFAAADDFSWYAVERARPASSNEFGPLVPELKALKARWPSLDWPTIWGLYTATLEDIVKPGTAEPARPQLVRKVGRIPPEILKKRLAEALPTLGDRGTIGHFSTIEDPSPPDMAPSLQQTRKAGPDVTKKIRGQRPPNMAVVKEFLKAQLNKNPSKFTNLLIKATGQFDINLADVGSENIGFVTRPEGQIPVLIDPSVGIELPTGASLIRRK